MVKEIFLKIIDSLERQVLNKEISLDKDKFVEVEKRQSDKKIAFIDGGQAELLKAANFSLQFIRTAALIYQNNKKIDSVINEFFVLISADNDKEFKTEIFPLKGEAIDNIRINSFDETIRDGNEKASISKIGNIVRRFAELDLGNQITADIIVFDGSLKCLFKGEKEYMDKLFEKEAIISSLAKTSRILSEKGDCILSQLNLLGKGTWYYSLDDSINIVKLNKNSGYVFEFDIFQKESILEVLGLLIANSNDAVFPGYAYGLIQADKTARVSNQERDYLITVFKANAGTKWNKLKANINVLNSHDILDNI